jgi:hypothetical protein
MPGAIPIGFAIDDCMKNIWHSERWKYLTDGVRYTCQCNVCPPFGNRVNFFLAKVRELSDKHGIGPVQDAIQRLRAKIGKRGKRR